MEINTSNEKSVDSSSSSCMASGSGDPAPVSELQDQQRSLRESLMEAVHCRAREHLRNDERGAGRRLYEDWERTKWKQQNLNCYDNQFFRDFYALAKLPWSVGISVQALSAVAAADAACGTVLLQWRSAVCIGCGPGSDAIALLSHSESQQKVLFLVDRCPGWQRLLSVLDERVRELRLAASVWFKSATVSDAAAAVRQLPLADIAVLSFAHSVTANEDLWPLLASRYKLVLVIDIESENLAAALQAAKYQSCPIDSQSAVSVFYHLS